MFLVYLADLPEQTSQTVESAPVAQHKPEPETRTISKPRFDFYKLLKESEVIVPATEPEPQQREAAPEQQTAEPRLQDREEFILQVGSFRRNDEADRLRAQLLLLNLEAYTEQVTLNNDQIWHRVLVGPFNNQSRLASARATLVSNEYNALVLKRQADH
ncbi:SPOR domain-containing protein [Marinimicrobium sp. ABcell2]|uniref:SPOR domain-containing protein n=1 Tax=Marinimicrobium sp. ABcell2 TaxID=3069751 RepID=UPI0027B55AC7|nr:SPOR domain-containing protein [Marinimicrobium sp. ABcell2]MDQ2076521.1 SPOR domain-containing protein [Marinimicrobium sp. ABcell2]